MTVSIIHTYYRSLYHTSEEPTKAHDNIGMRLFNMIMYDRSRTLRNVYSIEEQKVQNNASTN
jgi:hypothetical protein